MKVVSVVGARPQFVKAAAVCAAARERGDVRDLLVHTGQHYDAEMSDVFFAQLGIRQPDVELGIGSGSHGEQTAAMMTALEGTLRDLSPDVVLVYGDTNTTLAAAYAGWRLGIPVGHVESGLRSYNRRMPEEINRIVTDRVSTLLFCPSQTSVDNLAREGILEGVHLVGDVMFDILLKSMTRAKMSLLGELGVRTGSFYLMTLHRPSNADDPANLERILRAAARLPYPVIFPVHPRTRAAMEGLGLTAQGNLKPVTPVGYLEILALQMHARAILTDSGGMQKEAYFLGVPCVTLREETEWPETVSAGWNVLAGADVDRILGAVERDLPDERPELYGNGHTAAAIVEILAKGVWKADVA